MGVRVEVIASPSAGQSELLREGVRRLRERGAEVEVRLTWEPGQAQRLAAEVAGADRVVAAGGDGTINEVLQGLLAGQGRSVMGIAPFGTANDFALACGLKAEDAVAALEAAAFGEGRPVDIARIDGRPCLNAASIGATTKFTSEAPKAAKALLGRFAYVLRGIVRASDLQGQALRVEAEGLSWTGRALGMSIANGRYAGGGLPIAPQAWLNDGQLDILIVPEAPWSEVLSWLEQELREPGESDAPLIRARVRDIEVCSQTEEPLAINLDGEPYETHALRARVDAGAILMSLPEGAPLMSREAVRQGIV